MMTTTLVTGAQGFTGRYLCSALHQVGHRVVPLACDLTDANAVQKCILDAKPDNVVHLAGISFIHSTNLEAYYYVNVIGTCNLLDALKTCPPRKILIASSANVYGQVESGNRPISETQPPAPINHYGASKLAMEHMVRTYGDVLPIVITRPFNYTGPGQDESFLIPKMVAHFARKATEIALGNLDVSRDFMSIHDLVQAYIAILTHDLAGETLNICSGTAISLWQILQWLEEISGHSLTIKTNPQFVRQHDIKVLCGDHTRLTQLTDWTPKQALKDLLKEMLAACAVLALKAP